MQRHEEWHKIKELSEKKKAVRMFNKLDIDCLVAFHEAKCTVEWADGHTIKAVCRLN